MAAATSCESELGGKWGGGSRTCVDDDDVNNYKAAVAGSVLTFIRSQ